MEQTGKNLTVYLFNDERGRHFEVIAPDFSAAVMNAIVALAQVSDYRFRCPRYGGISGSLPGVTQHPLAEQVPTKHQAKVFTDAAHQTYESIAYDLWGGEFSGADDEFADCILEHIRTFGGLAPHEVRVFDVLPHDVRRRLVLEAQ